MSNEISLLVQLGVDTEPSKENLQKQINSLSKSLRADVEINFGDNAKTERTFKTTASDFKKISEAAKATSHGIDEVIERLKGIGKGSEKPTEVIKKQFKDLEYTLGNVFKDFSEESKKMLMQGTSDAEQIKKAFSGMAPVFKEISDVVTSETGKQAKELKALEVTYTNLATKARETLTFNNRSLVVMDNGDEKKLWLPDTKDIASVNSAMQQTEQNIQNAHKRLTGLRSEGKISTEQFNELATASQKMSDPNSINIFNQRLGETLEKNKQLSKEKREQIALEEKIRKLQNSIITTQNRDPKGMGNNSSVSGMLDTLKQIDPASKNASEKVKGVSDSFDRLRSSSVSASRESLTVLDSFKIAMEKFPIWMAASTVFYQTVRSASDAVKQIVQLDSQLTVLRRVGGSDMDVNKVLEESVRLAGELGNQISDINEGFIAFARQGFEGSELTMLAEYATLLGNISDLSVDESASILTAGLKAFNMETERGIHIVNALNEVDNSYSVTTNQLAMSMQRSAGTASVYGSTLERLIGYTTAIAEITRESGSVIGNSLKSVFSRITSVDGAISALDGIGISVKNQAGEMRAVDDILDDLGAQWNSLNAEQQQNIGLQVAGRYQLSRFLVLMNQYETAMEASETATNSAGSGYRENAEYLKSYEAQINMVKNSWTEAVLAMQDSGLGDAMILGLKAGLGFFNTLTTIIDKVGLLPFLLGGGAVAFALFNNTMRTSSMETGRFIASLLTAPPAFARYQASMVGSQLKTQLFATTVRGATATLNGLKAGMTFLAGAALPIAGFMLLGVAITKVTSAVTEHLEAQKELNKKVEEYKSKSIDAVTDHKERLQELVKEYKFLESVQNTSEWDSEKEERYLDVQQEIIDILPGAIDRIDEKGKAHAKTAEEIEKEIRKSEELLRKQRELNLATENKVYKEKIKEIKDYVDALDNAREVLELQIEAEKQALKGGYNYGDGAGRLKAEIDFEIKDSNLKSATDVIKRQLVSNIKDGLVLEGHNIIKPLEDALDSLTFKLNVEDIDDAQLAGIRKRLTDLYIEINNAFKQGDSKAFDNLVEQFNQVIESTGNVGDELDKLSPKYDGMVSTVKNYQEAMRNASLITDEMDESLSGLSESSKDAAEAFKKLVSSISYINGVLEDYQENNRLSSSTIMELIEKYPELIAHINDEAELIKALEQIRNNDIDTAQKALVVKLSKSEEFYKSNLQLIERFVKEQFKFYQGDLTQWKDLAQAKLEVETELINTLAKQWGVYYNTASQMFEVPLEASKHSFHIPGLDAEEDKKASANAKALDSMLTANEELKRFRNTWNDFSLGQVSIDFDAIGTSLDKNTKSTKDKTKAEREAAKAMEYSKFVADQYKHALEGLNLEIKKQQDIQSQFPEYTNQYNDALQKEITLQKEKMTLLQEQEKNLQAQIKAGNILQTGIVTTKSDKPQNLSGWGGTINSQYGMRKHPIYGDTRMHDGIDIGGKRGTRLDANVAGKVTFAGNSGNGLGNYVVIEAEDGLKHIYGHLDKVVATLGQTITAGMQIGNIGNTGASKGSHLHYQVNDKSGKSINPASYLDSARKGISDASKEVAQVHQQIDSAKSELVGIQGQMMDQENLITQLEMKSIGAHLSKFDRKRTENQQIIDYEIAKIAEVDIASERYGKTLDKVARHLNAKQRANKEELASLEELIKKGGLTGTTLETMKDRVWELKNEMFALNSEIQNIDLDRLNALMGRHDEIINDINFEYQRAQALMALYEEGTADYNEQLANTIEFQKQERDAVKAKIEASQQELLTLNLGTEAMKDKKDEIQGLIVQYWNLSGAVLSSEKSLEASRKKLAEDAADAYINAYKSYVSEKRDMTMRSYDDEMKVEDRRHKNVMDNYKKESDAFRKIIQEQIDAIDKVENERSYSKEIDKLEEERLKVMNRLNLLSLDDSLEAKAERKKLSEDLSKIDEDLFEKRNAKEVTDRKDNLNEMLKAKEEQIQKEEQAANEQHEAAKDRIDKERRYWDQFYTDQLNDERKFAQMKEDIVAGNFDKMSQEFQDYIKEMEDTMPDLVDTLDGTMQAVGTSIRQNLIDNLREALNMLSQVNSNNMAVPAPGGTGSLGTGAGGSLGSSPSQSKASLSSADLNVLTGKFLNDRLAAQESNPVRKGKIKEKAYELADKGRSSGSSIGSNLGFDAAIAGLSKEDLSMLGQHLQGSGSQHVSTPELQDFIKRFGQQLMNSSMKLNTGGYIKKGSQGLAMLHEQEVVLNKPETKKLFDLIPILEKLNNLISPITMPKVNAPDLAGAGGDVSYNFELFIDKMTGTKKDVDNFMDEIDNRLKRKGLK